MRLIVGIIVLAVVAGGGYLGYKKFAMGEDVTLEGTIEQVKSIEVPDVDVNIDPYPKGVAMQRTTDYEGAIAEFKKAINGSKDPAEVEHAHFRIAQCYSSAKKYAEAIQSYKLALRKYPNSEHAEKAKKALDKLELERG